MLRSSRIRILPVLIFIAVLFLGFRINHFIAILSGAVNPEMLLQKADAAADSKAETPPATTPPVADEKAAPPAPAAEAKAGAGKSGEGGEGKFMKTPEQVLAELKIKPKIYEPQLDDLGEADKKILEELTSLKTEILDKKKTLEEREVLIQVTEKRVDEKITELKALKNQIEAILGKLDQEQKEKILSLVKVYEAMKPKDAARIFDTLEMDVLIEVADHMKEARLAPIMAKMNDGKAKSLTRLMAERKKFSG